MLRKKLTGIFVRITLNYKFPGGGGGALIMKPFSSLKSAFCLSKVYSSVFLERPFPFPVVVLVTVINAVFRLPLFLTTDFCLILDYRVTFPLDGKPGVFFFFFLPPSCPAAGQCEWQ